MRPFVSFFFFCNDTATTEIYTLSLHDALPICAVRWPVWIAVLRVKLGSSSRARSEGRLRSTPYTRTATAQGATQSTDRKSTRLNSSHGYISYAVFCLKKKKTERRIKQRQLHDP